MNIRKIAPRFALALAATALSGTAVAQGGTCCPFSDASLKESPIQLSNATARLLELKGVEFTWKEAQQKDIGLIAQDVQAVYPQLVHKKNDLLTVDYEKLVAPLIESIRELNQRIATLEKAQASVQ